MNNWEYKLREFTGSIDTFREFLYRESGEEWQLGALFPLPWTGDAHALAEIMAAPSNHIYLMFKRQVPLTRSRTASLKTLL